MTHLRIHVSSVSCLIIKAARLSRCMCCLSPRPSSEALTLPRGGAVLEKRGAHVDVVQRTVEQVRFSAFLVLQEMAQHDRKEEVARDRVGGRYGSAARPPDGEIPRRVTPCRVMAAIRFRINTSCRSSFLGDQGPNVTITAF